MIRYKLLISLALSVTMMVACSKTDTPRPSMSNSYSPSTTPISFQTEDNWDYENTSKAAELKSDFAINDAIGVIGYYLPGNGATAPTKLSDDATPNFMYNQGVIYDGSNWSYTPIKYWPDNSSDRLQFFAYYPHNDGITLSDNTAEGYPTIRFEPAVKPYKQVDFMTATSAMVGKENKNVIFNFKHQLSQVSFQAQHNGTSGHYDVVITGITLAGAKIYKGHFNADGFEWSSTNGVKTHSYEATDDYKEIKKGIQLTNDSYTIVTNEAQNGIMLLTPQKLSAGEIKIYVTFDVLLPKQSIPIEVTQEIVVTKAHEYLKGKKLSYQFTLDVENLAVARLDGIKITDWFDGGIIHTEEDLIL